MDILSYIAIVSPSGKAKLFLITYFWFSFYFPKHDIFKNNKIITSFILFAKPCFLTKQNNNFILK